MRQGDPQVRAAKNATVLFVEHHMNRIKCTSSNLVSADADRKVDDRSRSFGRLQANHSAANGDGSVAVQGQRRP